MVTFDTATRERGTSNPVAVSCFVTTLYTSAGSVSTPTTEVIEVSLEVSSNAPKLLPVNRIVNPTLTKKTSACVSSTTVSVTLHSADAPVATVVVP